MKLTEVELVKPIRMGKTLASRITSAGRASSVVMAAKTLEATDSRLVIVDNLYAIPFEQVAKMTLEQPKEEKAPTKAKKAAQ